MVEEHYTLTDAGLEIVYTAQGFDHFNCFYLPWYYDLGGVHPQAVSDLNGLTLRCGSETVRYSLLTPADHVEQLPWGLSNRRGRLSMNRFAWKKPIQSIRLRVESTRSAKG